MGNAAIDYRNVRSMRAAQAAWDNAVPPGYYDDDIARERASDQIYQEYIATGHLPNMQDAGTVDEMLLDRMPDCLHELTLAAQRFHGRSEAIEAVANKIIGMRQEIIDELIDEALDKLEGRA